jgi:hypothetical protein
MDLDTAREEVMASFTRFGLQFDKIEARAMAAVQSAAESSKMSKPNHKEAEFITQAVKKMLQALGMWLNSLSLSSFAGKYGCIVMRILALVEKIRFYFKQFIPRKYSHIKVHLTARVPHIIHANRLQ